MPGVFLQDAPSLPVVEPLVRAYLDGTVHSRRSYERRTHRRVRDLLPKTNPAPALPQGLRERGVPNHALVHQHECAWPIAHGSEAGTGGGKGCSELIGESFDSGEPEVRFSDQRLEQMAWKEELCGEDVTQGLIRRSPLELRSTVFVFRWEPEHDVRELVACSEALP